MNANKNVCRTPEPQRGREREESMAGSNSGPRPSVEWLDGLIEATSE